MLAHLRIDECIYDVGSVMAMVLSTFLRNGCVKFCSLVLSRDKVSNGVVILKSMLHCLTVISVIVSQFNASSFPRPEENQ